MENKTEAVSGSASNTLTDEQITRQVADMQLRLDACAQAGQTYSVKWRDVKSIIATIQTLQVRLADAKKWQMDVEEREAAVCPEDVPFDEYIHALESALQPFAAVLREGADPNEAVLVANGHLLLNRHLERAAQLCSE